MNHNKTPTKFSVGDRVEIIDGVPGVWVVLNKIITPPSRWDPAGDKAVDQISYQLKHACDTHGRTVDEDRLRLVQ